MKSDGMKAECGGGQKPWGTKAGEGDGQREPISESALSAPLHPKDWAQFSPCGVYRLTHLPYKSISQHLPRSPSVT